MTSLHYHQAILLVANIYSCKSFIADTAFMFSDQSSLNNGKSKKKASYVRLMSRATERKL